MTGYVMLIVNLLVLIFLLYRQRQIRQVRKNADFGFLIILIILGLYILVNYFDHLHMTETSLASIIISLSFLAVGMGAVRAYTVRLWQEGNTVFRQGTWLTVGLWIVSVVLHLVVDRIGQTGEVTLLVYYGITLLVQRWVIQSRATHSFQI